MKHTTATPLCVPAALLLSLAFVPSVKAQFFKAGHQASASYSYSGASEVARGSSMLGELSAQYSSLEYAYGQKFDEQLLGSFGVSYQGTLLDAPVSIPVPDKLQELSLRLGGQYRLSDTKWSLFASASPGFREAGTGLDSKAFSVPIMAGASLAQKPGLIWSFGAAYNEFSQYKFIPFAGVYWRFAPRWALSVGYPQLGLSFQANDALTVRAGASAKGGSYWVKHVVSSLSSEAPYHDTMLDYREIRVGLGADWKMGQGFKLSLDGGVVTDRKIQYHQINRSFNGDPTAYVAVALNYAQ